MFGWGKKKSKKRKRSSKSFSYRIVRRIKRANSFGFNLLLMLFSIVIVFHSGFIYMINFHNLDLSYNVALITNDVNNYFYKNNISKNFNYRDLADTYDIGKSAPYTTFYVYSSDSLVERLFFAIVGAVMFGFSFAYNIMLYEFKKVKK